MKELHKAQVLSSEFIAPKTVELVMLLPETAGAAEPGQFISIYPDDGSLILPRPFGIHDADRERGTVSIIYEIVGEGTSELSEKKAGEYITAAGPLGKGFDLSSFDEAAGKSVILAGGGVGSSVLLFTARKLKEKAADITAVLGFREYPFGAEEFEKLGCRVFVATDRPAEGTFTGNVCQCMDANALNAESFMACGPEPMLRGVTDYVKTNGKLSELQLSLDGRMGCGYGVCLGCSITLNSGNGTVRKRVCADGPVFRGDEVIW